MENLSFQVETISTEFHGTEAPKLLWTTFCDCTAGSLSTLELEDVMIDGNGKMLNLLKVYYKKINKK